MRKLYRLASLLSFIGVLGYTSASAQYCAPQYSYGCGVGDEINNFFTTGGQTNISNLNSGCSSGNYTYYPNQIVTGVFGDTINFSIQAGPSYQQGHRLWIDWNDDGDFTDAGEDVWNSGTYGYNAFTGSFIVPTNAMVGTNLRLRTRCQYVGVPADPCASTTYGEGEDYNVFILPPVADDAGIAEINTPSVGNCTLGSISTTVTANCLGTDTLRSFTVNWSVNGNVQTPVSVSGLAVAPLGGTHGPITLGNYTYVDGDTLCVWTTNPNNVTDSFPSNDSICFVVKAAMGGTYTIGGASPDFGTIDSAIAELNERGVCSAVEFKIRPGTYTEQVTIGSILGSSSSNTVTFMADTGGAVSIEHSASGTTDNWVVKLDGATYVKFMDLTIKPNGSTYSTALEFNGGASNNTFMNCLFDGNTSTTGTYTRVIYCQSAGNNYNHFENNVISGGYYGAYVYGSAADRNVGIEWIGNDFVDQYYQGTYFYYSSDLIFNHNTITSTRNYSSMYPLYIYYSSGATEIVGNNINCPGYMGMYLGYIEGNANEKPLIANNMVRIGKNAGTYGYGFYLYGGGFARVVNNTVVATHSSYTYYGFYIQGGANSVINNNYYETNGYSSYAALYYNGGFSILESDHNNVYTSRNYGYYNGYQQDLAAWQANTPWGDNSLDSDPGFTNYDSLRTCSDTLDGAGMPLSYITDDFDGDGRNPNTPDIGADEWVGSDSNAFSAGPDALVCGKEISIGLPVTGGTFLWNTSDTTPTITVTDEGTYTVAMTSVCGSSHIDTVEVVDATATADFSVLSKFLTGQFTNTSVNDDSRMWVIQTNPADTSYSNDLTYLFPDNGPYQVDLYIYNDCDTDMVSKTWNGWVGVDENSLGNLISLMPNPATSNLNIQFGNVEGDVTVEMMNIQGQLVYSSRFMNVTNDVQSIDVSSLRKGMYVVKFITNNEIATKQIIVQ